MTIMKIDLTNLLWYWSQQRDQYMPSAYVMLLCGEATRLDRQVFEYVIQHRLMLDDMSGPYTSLTLVGWRLDQANPAALPQRPMDDLEYLHAASSWAFGAPAVYSLANALELPIQQFPLLLISADPWTSNEVLIVSMRDLRQPEDVEADHADQFAIFFSALLSACRETRTQSSGKKLLTVRKELKPYLADARSGRIKKFADSGVLSQIIEGVLKGLGIGG